MSLSLLKRLTAERRGEAFQDLHEIRRQGPQMQPASRIIVEFSGLVWRTQAGKVHQPGSNRDFPSMEVSRTGHFLYPDGILGILPIVTIVTVVL